MQKGCSPINLKKATIYVVRLTTDGKLANSAPCVHCWNKIKKMGGIKRLVYSTDNHAFINIKFKEYLSQHISSGNKNIDY